MDEDYLAGLQKQVKQEESQLRRLQDFKDKLQKEINELRSIRDEGERDSKTFVRDEIKRITTRVGKAKRIAEEEIERSMDKIKQINDIARALKDEGEEIDKKRVLIQADIITLESSRRKAEGSMAKAEGCLRAAKEKTISAGEDKVKATREAKIASKSLERAKEVLDEIEDYKVNILQKLQEDRDILEEKDKVLSGGYAALGAGMKWVEKEKMKIKDEWVSLIKAKEYLNTKNGS